MMPPLEVEMRNLIAKATNLPADGKEYITGDVTMTHKPLTRMHVEQVLVTRYGVTFRSRFVKGKWQATEQV